jgi:hypothetical protein
MKRYLIIIAGCMGLSFSALAQDIPPGMEITEIFNIMETYRQAPHVSFDVQFQYADSTQPAVILEQLYGNYKMQNGKIRGRIDSTEFIQGDVYNLTVFHDDSIISVSDRQRNNDLLRLPFLDSVFRNQNIDSMYITQLNDSTRSLKINFKTGSGYSGYELQYDLNNYYIRKIQYAIPGANMDENSTGSSTSIVSIFFTNYNTAIIDESNFREDAFIRKQGTQLFAQPAYNGFRVLVNTSN